MVEWATEIVFLQFSCFFSARSREEEKERWQLRMVAATVYGTSLYTSVLVGKQGEKRERMDTCMYKKDREK